MGERPILFSGPMVRAILDGRKSQTRRLLKPQPVEVDDAGRWYRMPSGGLSLNCENVLYHVGDRLWAKEAFCGSAGYDRLPPSKWGNKPIWYAADGVPDYKLWGFLSTRSRPSIHMPRWASRLTLTVTDVRVQRLQEISEADARAEGVSKRDWEIRGDFRGGEGPDSYREAFEFQWNSINAKRPGCAWDDNPWVVVVGFSAERRNIDAGAG